MNTVIAFIMLAQTYILVSDPLAVPAEWPEVKIDGAIDSRCTQASPCLGANMGIELDVTSLVGSSFTVEARSCKSNPVVCSDWTAPEAFDLRNPQVPSNIRIEIRVSVGQ